MNHEQNKLLCKSYIKQLLCKLFCLVGMKERYTFSLSVINGAYTVLLLFWQTDNTFGYHNISQVCLPLFCSFR